MLAAFSSGVCLDQLKLQFTERADTSEECKERRGLLLPAPAVRSPIGL